MGIILGFRRMIQPRMADLVRQERSFLESAIGGVPYELFDEGKDLCRVETKQFTVSLMWMYRERWVQAELEVHDVHDHPLDPHATYPARTWLEARGLPTLPQRSGPMSSLLVREELTEVGEVVAHIFACERELRQALFYLSGYSRGYTDRVIVPEEAPPPNVQQWAEAHFRRMPKWD